MNNIPHDEQVIIAQCTPSGKGAIALLRLSGTHVFQLVTKISSLAPNKNLADAPSHTIAYGWVVDDNSKHIDQVLFLLMRGPKTFTGQDCIEITCHNNPFIIESIIAQAIKHGARLAQEGEFTKRGFLNGKIDLIQAEAINELIHANTQSIVKKSLEQLEGSFSHWITTIEQQLLQAISYCHASFEFIDEEIEFAPQIQININETLSTIAQLKKSFNQQQHLREGIRIALIGTVNAGKSSLFNALLGKDRAIVTQIAGTTRDTVEAGVYRNGNYWTLIDTAGLRQTEDVIEKEGISRSMMEAGKADIIILTIDGSRALSTEEKVVYQDLTKNFASKIIITQTKADLPVQSNPFEQNAIAVSTVTKKNIDTLEHAMEQKITAILKTSDAPFLVNQRQYNLLLGLERQLIKINKMIATNDVAYEILSYELHNTLEHLTELTGKTIANTAMNKIFKEFCVGK